MAHGPGQVGIIAMESPELSRFAWVPTSDALEFLTEFGCTAWLDRLRACPPTLAPIVTMFRSGDLMLTVAPGQAMSPGGEC